MHRSSHITMALQSQSLCFLSLGILIVLAVLVLELLNLSQDKSVLERAKIFPHTTEFPLWLNKKGRWHIFIFNTTNPDDVLLGRKPTLKELGPYVYEEMISKTNIQFHLKTDAVSYKTHATQNFSRDQSNGLETDEIWIPVSTKNDESWAWGTNLNLPYDDRDDPWVSNSPKRKRFMKISVKSLLEGTYIPECRSSSDREASTGQTFTRLGPFNKYNDAKQYTEIHLGSKELQFKDIGQLFKWMGQPNLAFLDDNCSAVNGTDGTVFPPKLSRHSVLPVFVPYLSRSVFFKYSRETVVNAVPGYRFDLPNYSLDYGGNSVDNYCHCESARDQQTNCRHDGKFRMDLFSGLKFVISLPHFLDDSSQASTTTGFEGLKPVPDRHQSFIELEPSSGFVLSTHYRFQLNALVYPSARGRPTVYPILWWDYQYTDLSVPAVNTALLGTGEPVSSRLSWAKWFLLFLGIAVGLVGILVHFKDMTLERERVGTPSRAALINA